MVDLYELFTDDEYTIPSGIFGHFVDGKLVHKDFVCFKCNHEYKNIPVGEEPKECVECGRKMLWK